MAKSGYDKRKPVKDNPRTPKPVNGGIGPDPSAKRAQDGTGANAKGMSKRKY